MKQLIIGCMSILMMACTGHKNTDATGQKGTFSYEVDQFADLQILRYQVPGFESLSLKQKQLLYHLSEAGLMGRDILFDQNNRYNLVIRRLLETVYAEYKWDHGDVQFKALKVYLKRVWFSNGIHHHYGEDKFVPGFTPEFLTDCIKSIDASHLPLRPGQNVDQFMEEIYPVIFNPEIMSKKTVQSGEQDLILASANNYYAGGITQKEVEKFYDEMRNPNDSTPISYGLNSRLVKEADGRIVEKVWKVGGLYTEAIEKIVSELEKAVAFAENDTQKAVIEKLIAYYKNGDLRTFDEYAILWVNDTQSDVDFINGFTETYGDPLGMKASWESTVNFINKEATERTKVISNNAQWFEDHSPMDDRFKKKEVKGVTAKVITVAMLGGDCYPATPIGINLPNADWIRHIHGSKSVTIENITEAYDKASQGGGFNEEFVWSDAERELIKKYGFITDNLHTDLHECLGHGSGIILPGVDPNALKSYSSTLEEARADLFGLYYMGDAKLLELGLVPDKDAYKSEYYKFMMNGLMTQLVRIDLGKNMEEAHMRNRQLIARWVYEKGQADKVVELKKKDNKTYVVINDYIKLRNLFGQLLAEAQRIKSEGDYAAGQRLVEDYAVKVDPVLHAEVLERYARLNLSPYRGFVNPVMKEVKNAKGEVTDIVLDYTEGYTEQMLRYSKDYSFLPSYN
ncbi:dipeptidyl-peptidase-3 [Parabacteroides sp. PF5-5]|uniref:dipeptidyl-peptidase 3 family protein n=1 Tax=unclassified Parabacteroides TaxID=2649774 RepID=UPI00247726F2|nr:MULTISPECIES: dihydrofolate reductase [unclassified Parabacteroides]MDH6305666.1 dipeptidyl-peptidase-3 [Parabacteroides sp. PH5-39]MDH6316738.1 dipeptidyl-peptidase-3 [Parabacteroides sp. PF5-13]MDH6320379.1 dipeptidyl-peptidase-3 [Parabacteroides sp. PH5-13]MDH6324109.1 dipeptidyl-peptidase-3 [Parabacteroides sp. PH5-8]MDH6327924.1 dipeptidyl-peptidase-3 [Parabacteroides sp. PH5-41]